MGYETGFQIAGFVHDSRIKTSGSLPLVYYYSMLKFSSSVDTCRLFSTLLFRQCSFIFLIIRHNIFQEIVSSSCCVYMFFLYFFGWEVKTVLF